RAHWRHDSILSTRSITGHSRDEVVLLLQRLRRPAGLLRLWPDCSRWRLEFHSLWTGARLHSLLKGFSSSQSAHWRLAGSALAPLFFILSAGEPIFPSARVRGRMARDITPLGFPNSTAAHMTP